MAQFHLIEKLYWRGMVLNQFDNRAWRTLEWKDHPAIERQLERPTLEGDSLHYHVIMEPSMQNWLYALPYAESDSRGVFETWDFRLAVAKPLESTFSYKVVSQQPTALQPVLSQWRRETELAFPPGLNPRTRAWVAEQLAAVEGVDDFILRVLRYFREQPFFYTLEPPAISDDDFVDQFIFNSRRGFCEHYAYSFVVIMRMAGIPSRIVGGYQGGEVNDVNNTLVVRQFDAHAWTEIWLENRGWVRVDPTAAVSPARIELGLESALAGGGAVLDGFAVIGLSFSERQYYQLAKITLRRCCLALAKLYRRFRQRGANQFTEIMVWRD